MSTQIQTYLLTKVIVCPLANYIGDDVNKVIQVIQNIKEIPSTLKCPKCGQEIEIGKFALHLLKHRRITGKHQVCDICGDKFTNEGQLLRHMREHLVIGVFRHGMWVWYCTVCGREFTSKKSALVHVLKSHEVEK